MWGGRGCSAGGARGGAEIQGHPWFLRDLPPGVAEMNSRLVPPGAPSIKSFCMPEGVQVPRTPPFHLPRRPPHGRLCRQAASACAVGAAVWQCRQHSCSQMQTWRRSSQRPRCSAGCVVAAEPVWKRAGRVTGRGAVGGGAEPGGDGEASHGGPGSAAPLPPPVYPPRHELRRLRHRWHHGAPQGLGHRPRLRRHWAAVAWHGLIATSMSLQVFRC